MAITGYYDGTSVRVNESLRMNQKVIVIPIENEIFKWQRKSGL